MDDFLTYLDKNLSKVTFNDDTDNYVESLSSIGNLIVEARNSSNITQKELSEITKIQQSTISKIESGTYNLSLKMLQRIADGLGKRIVIKFE